MSTREEVYRAIDGECAYQAADAGIDFSSVDRTLHVILMCIGQHIAGPHEARGEGTDLELLRKVGAFCVGSMEVHGAPEREGWYRMHIIRSGETVSIPGKEVLALPATALLTVPVETRVGTQAELEDMLEDMGETNGC